MTSQWTSLELSCKPVKKNYGHFIKYLKRKNAFQELMNEGKIASKKAFTGNQFRSDGNHENNNNEKALFCVFLQIVDLCFNP